MLIFLYKLEMKKIAFLSCDDLTDFVVDDNLLYDSLKKNHPEILFDVVSWSDESINWSNYRFAILRTTWDYTKKIKPFIEKMKQIESSGCELFNPLHIIKWNSFKTYLKDLADKKVPIIDSYFLETESINSLKLKLNEDKQYVIKPVVGASADHIQILSKDEILKKVSSIQDHGIEEIKKWFIQPFIKEVALGERSLFFLNSKFSHAVKKVPKDGDFRVQEEHGGLITSYKPTEEEHQFANHAIEAIGQNLLYARIDFLKTNDGPKLIEMELIEPSFYFRTDLASVTRFIDSVVHLYN